MSQADELQARTDAFADLSLKFVEGLPNTDWARRLAGQYQDASTSAAANYSGGAARALARGVHIQDRDRFGGGQRIRLLAERMLNANIRSTTAPIEPLLAEAEELARIFGASHRTAKRRRKRGDDQ